eukprot:g34380.t1
MTQVEGTVDWNRRLEKYKLRLEAETGLGVSAALIGGFSFSLLAEAREMNGIDSLLFSYAMGAAGALSLFTVIVSTSLFWSGLHILSASRDTVEQEVELFKTFWKDRKLQLARTCSRRTFQLAIVCFSFSCTVLVYEVTDEISILIWTSVVVTLSVCVGLWFSRVMEKFATSRTATA